MIQATETVKLILGIGEPLVGRLLLYDALAMRFRELKLRKNPECPVCGDHPTITKLIDYHQFCGSAAAGAASPQQEANVTESEIDATEVKAEARSRRQFRPDRRARAARVSDLQHPGSQADPARRRRQAPGRARSRGRDRDPLQERRAQRESLRHPESRPASRTSGT